MNLQNSIDVANRKIKWLSDGVYVPYNKLNANLLQQALRVLVDNAELILKEGNGLANK